MEPIKILSDGTHLPSGSDRTDHVAVLLPALGLMVHPVSLGTPKGEELKNWDACDERCRALRVLGFDDWQLASREDWNAILDLTRHDHAVDPSLYPGIKPRWHWTSTPAAWSASAAWLVGVGNGLVGYSRRYSGFALAVRRAAPTPEPQSAGGA